MSGAGLLGAGVVGTSLRGEAAALPPDTRPTAAAPSLTTDPFTLGVASGDPLPNGVVIWTRLATQPLADNGLGGMPERTYPVRWEVAADERFRRVVAAGRTTARAESAHAVHVEVNGLKPDREYWYRFATGQHQSRIGRTHTAPRRNAMPSSLAMAMVSCSQFEHGYFTAYRRLAEDRPQLVLHLGDYQYEYTKDDYTIPGGNVRDHLGPETVTLANYRQRHAQYKTDPDLQEAHAVAPWLTVWDDHEVDNNWADEIPENAESVPGFLNRRAAAFRAYYENLPLRRSSVPRGIDLQLFRQVQWGRLATFHMLDTRQYRDDQACDDGYDDCPAADDPNRTLTGRAQERWLLNGLAASRARWDLLGQQVFFAQRDSKADDSLTVSMDAWDGYRASRERVTQGWVDAQVRNPVVLTGDVHSHWASEVKLDYADPDAPSVGTELVCSSITSGGDGVDTADGRHAWFAQNEHLKFYNNLRGYVNATVHRDRIDVDFRSLPEVSSGEAEAFTRRSYTIADRDPTLHLTADNPSTSKTRREQGISRQEQSAQTIREETERP